MRAGFGAEPSEPLEVLAPGDSGKSLPLRLWQRFFRVHLAKELGEEGYPAGFSQLRAVVPALGCRGTQSATPGHLGTIELDDPANDRIFGARTH